MGPRAALSSSCSRAFMPSPGTNDSVLPQTIPGVAQLPSEGLAPIAPNHALYPISLNAHAVHSSKAFWFGGAPPPTEDHPRPSLPPIVQLSAPAAMQVACVTPSGGRSSQQQCHPLFPWASVGPKAFTEIDCRTPTQWAPRGLRATFFLCCVLGSTHGGKSNTKSHL